MAFPNPKLEWNDPLQSLNEATIVEGLVGPSTHFECIHCHARLWISEESFAKKRFSGECRTCGHKISIERVYNYDNMEVVELLGCQYTSPLESSSAPLPFSTDEDTVEGHQEMLDWIANEGGPGQSTKIDSDPGILQKSFLDELVSQWTVKKRNGQVYSFEYFSVIRKWIEEGKLVSGDEIVPSDGRAYRIEEYPGTADLFGNVVKRAEARFAMGPRVEYKRRRRFSFGSFLVRGLTVLVSAALLSASPFAYRWWQMRDGVALLRQETTNIAKIPADRFVSTLVTAKELLKRDEPELLPKSAAEFLKVIAVEPEASEAVAGLAEVWTEIGAHTGSAVEFQKAATLLQYGYAIDSKNPFMDRAKARLLWRQGKPEAAAEFLSTSLSSRTGDSESHGLLADIATDTSDYVTAAYHLSQAIQADSTNAQHYLKFSRLLSKQSKYSEAIAYLKRGVSLLPDSSTFTDDLAELYQKEGDFAGLEKLHREAIGRDENIESHQLALVKLFSAQKNTTSTINEALEYFRLFPDGANYQNVKSLYQAAIDETKAAVTANSNSKNGSTDKGTRSSGTQRRRIRRR